MKIKYSYFILFLIIIFVSLQAVSASDVDDNQTILSNEMSKDTFGISIDINEKIGDSGTFSELQTEVDRGGTIDLDKNYTIGEEETEVMITKDIIINGNGNTINGNFNSRIFNIVESNLILQDITFINGNYSTLGSVLNIISSNVTLKNVKFSDNIGSSVIYVSDDETNLTIDYTLFTQNNVTAITFNGHSLNINNTQFTLNNNTNLIMNGGILNSINSTFKDNDGLSVSISNSEAYINKNQFLNNHATNTGIYVSNSYLNLMNSVFNGNIAWNSNRRNVYAEESGFYEVNNNTFDVKTEFYIYNLKEEGNETVKIFFHDGTNLYLSPSVNLKLNNELLNNFIIDADKTIEYNLTNLKSGEQILSLDITDSNGNIYNIDTSAKKFKVMDGVEEVVHVNSTSSWDDAMNNVAVGGTIIIDEGEYSDIINKIIYQNLTVKASGKVILNAHKQGRIFFITNDAVVTIDGLTFVNATTILSNWNNANYGGAIYWNSINGTINNCNFINNSAGCGGAVYWTGDNGILNNTNFTNNSAKYGGALYWSGNNNTLSYSNFTKNIINITTTYTAGMGGAVLIRGANNIITYSKFNNNFLSLISTSSDYHGGGAVCVEGTNNTITYSEFKNNIVSRWYGGAVYILGSYNTVTNSNFTNNSAVRGGAIYWGGSDGTLIYSNFTRNKVNITSAGCGGAVYWGGSNGNISYSEFNNNFLSVKTTTNDKGGAAVCVRGSNTVITYSEFKNNIASGFFGGAVYWTGSNGTLIYSNFADNSANYGGAVYWGGSNGTLIYSNFADNSANYGGAVYWGGSNGSLSYSNFTRNKVNITSAGCGGAVYWGGSNGNISYSEFNNNFLSVKTTTNDKGGAAVCVRGSNTVITYSEFKNNIASGFFGGAVYWTGSEGSLSYSNFTNNSASYGSVYWTGSNGTLSYSNFTNNTVSTSGGGVYWTGSDGTLSYSNFTKNIINITTDWTRGHGGAVYWSGSNGILNYSYFKDNYLNVIRTSSVLKGGGAVCWDGSKGILGYSTFINNFANIYGGAILWNKENGKIISSYFKNNTSPSGADIYSLYSLTILNSSFENKGTGEVKDIQKGEPETIKYSLNTGIRNINVNIQLTDILLNGISKATITSNSGEIKMEGLPQGAYNLSLKDSNNNIYYYLSSNFTVSGNDYFFISPNGTGIGVTDLNPANLTYALSNIDENKIIYFLDGIYTDLDIISKELSLIGYSNGAIISSTLTISSIVTIDNLIFKNANTAIQNTGTLTITNSTFTNNTINIAGAGSVDISNSIISIDNSISDTFIDKTISLGNVDSKIADYDPIISVYVNGNKETQSSFTRDVGVYNIKVNDTKGNVYKMDNDTFVVYTYTIYIAPNANGYGINETNPTSFEKAYNIAINGVNIQFADGTYNIVNRLINKNINLTGSAILTANNQGNIFNITSNVNITNLTFTNALVALNITQGTSNIINSAFENNNIGIYVGTTVNISNSTFAGNNQGIYQNSGTLNIENSTFTKNTQAIYISQGSVNIKDSVFDENIKTTYRNIENYGIIKIMNSTFDLADTLNMSDVAEGQTVWINGTIDDGTNLDTYNLTVGNETRSVGKVISQFYINLSIGYYNVTLVGSGTNSYRFKRELGFSVYGSKVYISPEGTGYGSSINDTTSWQYAQENLIRDDVEVIFTNGTYIIQSNVLRNYIKKLSYHYHLRQCREIKN